MRQFVFAGRLESVDLEVALGKYIAAGLLQFTNDEQSEFTFNIGDDLAISVSLYVSALSSCSAEDELLFPATQALIESGYVSHITVNCLGKDRALMGAKTEEIAFAIATA